MSNEDLNALADLEKMMDGLQAEGEVYKAYHSLENMPQLCVPCSALTQKENPGKYKLTLTCGCPNSELGKGSASGSCQWTGDCSEEGGTFVQETKVADKNDITCYSASVALTRGVTINEATGQTELNLVWTRGLSGEEATKNISSKKIARLNWSEGSKRFLNKDLSTAGATGSINGVEASLTMISAGATGLSISLTGLDSNLTGAIFRFRGIYKSTATTTVCFSTAKNAVGSILNVLFVNKKLLACTRNEASTVKLS